MDRKLSHKAGLRFYFLLFLFFVEKILKSFLEYCLNLVKFLCVFNRAKICVAVCLFLNLEKDYFAVVLKNILCVVIDGEKGDVTCVIGFDSVKLFKNMFFTVLVNYADDVRIAF